MPQHNLSMLSDPEFLLQLDQPEALLIPKSLEDSRNETDRFSVCLWVSSLNIVI